MCPLSPDEYICLLDKVNDAKLLAIAIERIAYYNPDTLISQKEVDQEFGFFSSDYKNTDGIDYE